MATSVLNFVDQDVGRWVSDPSDSAEISPSKIALFGKLAERVSGLSVKGRGDLLDQAKEILRGMPRDELRRIFEACMAPIEKLSLSPMIISGWHSAP
jgi:hypothetical protein